MKKKKLGNKKTTGKKIGVNSTCGTVACLEKSQKQRFFFNVSCSLQTTN